MFYSALNPSRIPVAPGGKAESSLWPMGPRDRPPCRLPSATTLCPFLAQLWLRGPLTSPAVSKRARHGPASGPLHRRGRSAPAPRLRPVSIQTPWSPSARLAVMRHSGNLTGPSWLRPLKWMLETYSLRTGNRAHCTTVHTRRAVQTCDPKFLADGSKGP